MKIKRPFLWLTQPLGGSPEPWLFFKIDGLMMNAYEIMQNNTANMEIREVGIHRYTKFNGLIAMDSGGFLFMRKRIIDVTPESIMSFYEESKPNFGVVLDYPLLPGLSRKMIRFRLSKTLENTKRMLASRQTSNPELVPVIHGYNLRSINRYVKKLQKIGEFNIYGIGSLVPSVFNTKGAGGIYNVVKIISYVRTILPTKVLHVFGVGSTLTMHLMFYAGADSIDSSSWRTKAAFGAIQLPGIGDRYITGKANKKKYRNLSRDEKKLLENCNCPACKENGLEGLKKSFELRALHNAWVHQKEIERIRRLIKKEEYEDYVKDIIGKTKFSFALRVIDKIRKT